MTRPIAILIAVVLLGLVVVIVATEQDIAAPKSDMSMLVLNLAAQILFIVGTIAYCGFAALHSTQHIDSPADRSMWLIATVAGNVLGSCWYYLSTYQRFRSIGQGGLMRFRSSENA